MEGEGTLREKRRKFPWLYGPRYYGEDSAGLLGGFSWPPRSYSCSFCRREFRSAQALGGHMNVHRRERARLRQSPPCEGQIGGRNPKPYPTPNPSFSSFSSITPAESPVLISPRFPSLLSATLSALPSSSFTKVKISRPLDPSVNPPCLYDPSGRRNTMKALFSSGETMSYLEEEEEEDDDDEGEEEEEGDNEDEDDDTVMREKGRMKLDLDIGLCTHPPENLDLELRLGCT